MAQANGNRSCYSIIPMNYINMWFILPNLAAFGCNVHTSWLNGWTSWECHLALRLFSINATLCWDCVSQFSWWRFKGKVPKVPAVWHRHSHAKGCGVFIECRIWLSVLSKCRCGAQMAATICFPSVVRLPQQWSCWTSTQRKKTKTVISQFHCSTGGQFLPLITYNTEPHLIPVVLQLIVARTWTWWRGFESYTVNQ